MWEWNIFYPSQASDRLSRIGVKVVGTLGLQTPSIVILSTLGGLP